MEDNDVARKGEKGNVLFLILIAVALFAALSYAVTQSTRSGGGSADKEKSILSGASMTQHPTALRTSIIRMILGGTDVESLRFNPPSAFGGDTSELVFHPAGGGALFQQAPADVMAGGSQGTWFYNGNFDVPQIGIDGNDGNDLIAFLPNVSRGVCEQVNSQFVIDTTNCTTTNGDIPDAEAAVTGALIKENMDDAYTFPTASDEVDLQGAGAGCAAFSGQASGCFYEDAIDEYVFFSVVLER